jgi:hypothetical protein
MRTKLLFTLIASTLLGQAACTSGLDETCASLAETQCGECFICAQGVDGVSGGELCGVGASATQAGCEQVLGERCAGQTSARKNPNADLERCEAALEGLTCEVLVERFGLDQRPSPAACQIFF